MGHRRSLGATVVAGDKLTRAMVGIGMLFAGTGDPTANIEDTLISASIAGMDEDDLRVLAVLTTWMGVHQARVNVDRLVRAVRASDSQRVRAYWAAVGQWLGSDRRYVRLTEVYRGSRINLLRVGNDFQIARSGEDARFSEGPLLVPANVLRDRKADVLSPAHLAARHSTYRWRVTIGPSYRADVWAALEAHPTLTAAQLARKTYSSFATAWHAKQDWALLAA